MVKKILIVDDDYKDLEDMKELLEKNKYYVEIATNGAQALDLIDSKHFDLILLDVKMPTLSGYDLLMLLREKLDGKTKMIFVTILKKSKVDLEDIDGFVQKPFTEKALLNEVKKVVNKK